MLRPHTGPVSHSNVLARLISSTKAFHAYVDEPWLGLLRPDVSRSDYLAVLVRMYGLLAPFESACLYAPQTARQLAPQQLARAGFIAQDLMALNLTAAQVATIPTCPELSMFSTYEESLGWLYVIERSTLLQHGLRPHLLARIPGIDVASTYLASCDESIHDRWAAFGDLVDAAPPEAAEAIVVAAQNGFVIAQSWFSYPHSIRSVG